MMYDDLIKDFASRTFRNLQYIQEGKAKGDEVFEVTALISSLLGLIVFPKEKLSLESFENQPCDLVKSGWSDIKLKEKTKNFADFFVKMRHAVAHGNIKAKSHSSNNEITDLTFWNINPNGNIKDWEINLSVSEIKQLVEKICPLIIHSSPLPSVGPYENRNPPR